jgi:hypothetical protein
MLPRPDFSLRETQGGAGTPRSGLNRRERDEDRRRELDRMRDEARAKRDAEAVSHPPPFPPFSDEISMQRTLFNLHAEEEKIFRFEQKFRDEKHSALYPNFLAASFRDEYERQKRREGKRNEEQEEGEMAQT